MRHGADRSSSARDPGSRALSVREPSEWIQIRDYWAVNFTSVGELTALAWPPLLADT